MKDFETFLREQKSSVRNVSFDHSSGPISTPGYTDVERPISLAYVVHDGNKPFQDMRLCVVYTKPRTDDGRSIDFYPPYGEPGAQTMESLVKAIEESGLKDTHKHIQRALETYQSTWSQSAIAAKPFKESKQLKEKNHRFPKRFEMLGVDPTKLPVQFIHKDQNGKMVETVFKNIDEFDKKVKSGYLGPMYGEDRKGNPMVRFESPSAYKSLSENK